MTSNLIENCFRPFRRPAQTLATHALAALLSVSALSTMAADDAAKVPEPPPPSRIHGLFNLEISDHYMTPRGLNVEDQGVIFQPLLLLFVNMYQGDGFINDVTLVPGVWNSIHTRRSGGTEPSYWNEIDPILGLSTKFAKRLDLSVTYTIFKSQNGSFDTSQHLETKLGFDDSDFLKGFALHPYFLYWQEIENKATPASTGPSYYFEVGVAPSYTIQKWNLKLEVPVRVLFPNERFYGVSSTVGLYEVGFKGTIPLNFMPKGYGSWSFHAGVKYFKLINENLVQWGSFLAPGHPDSDEIVFSCGISTFF